VHYTPYTLARMEELMANNSVVDYDPVQAAFDAVDDKGAVGRRV